jgi:hypothetical protein
MWYGNGFGSKRGKEYRGEEGKRRKKTSRPQQSMEEKNEEFMLHCLVSCRDIVRNLQIIFFFLREEP